MLDGKFLSAIITSAGSGRRMNSNINKPFLNIDNKKIIERTLDTVTSIEEFDEIILVIRRDDEDIIKAILENPKFSKKVTYAFGSSTRELSTFEGLKALNKDCELVLTHDGVRPFASKELFEKVLENLKEFKAVISAVKSKDTVKIVDENSLVKTTPLRKEVYNVQTPQAFDKEMILDFYEKYTQSNFTITDDSQLFEIYSDEKIKVVEGEYSNIKMTTPEDLIFAKAFLED